MHNTKADASTDSQTRWQIGARIAGLFVFILLGAVLIVELASKETDDAKRRWDDRLALVADSRSADASNWLNRHLSEVVSLASDASLQLYASLALSGENESAEAQRGYIFSFLSAASARSGFHERSSLDDVAANVTRSRRAGMAVMRADGSVLVATAGFPVGALKGLIDVPAGPTIRLGKSLEDKTPLVVFMTPVQGGDGMAGDAGPVAWLVGARPLDQGFWQTLKQPGLESETAETYVVIPRGIAQLQAITPLAAGGKIGDAMADAASLEASTRPGAVIEAVGYAGRSMLVTGREFTAPVDWILVHGVTAREAYEDVHARRNSLAATLGFAGLAVLIAIILAWRHGVSARLETAYQKEAELASKNKSLSHFLESLSNAQPTAIAALNEEFRIQFLNIRMAGLMNVAREEAMGLRFHKMFDHDVATKLEQVFKNPERGADGFEVKLLGKRGHVRTYRARLLSVQGAEAVREVTYNDTAQMADYMVVMEDVSDLIAARDRAEDLTHQLVGTLTRIIDARDPWSKYHSERVAEVGEAIAKSLQLDPVSFETVRFGGQLVNLGKIFVPTNILTKEGKLTDEEYQLVRDSLGKSADLIKGLAFKGPVGQTLGQINEQVDGKGYPNGLWGKDILLEARILAVANAFVGMVSARAHRSGIALDEALDLLNKDSGQRYDRGVVAALVSFIENQGGREQFMTYGDAVEGE